jgi:glucose-1-phosphate thymidylyltransferase
VGAGHLMQASNFIQAVQDRQGLMVSCPEEIAFRMGFIATEELTKEVEKMGNNSYRAYLQQLLQDDPFPFLNEMNS